MGRPGKLAFHTCKKQGRSIPNLAIEADNWDRKERLVGRNHVEMTAGLVLGNGVDPLKMKMGKKKDITWPQYGGRDQSVIHRDEKTTSRSCQEAGGPVPASRCSRWEGKGRVGCDDCLLIKITHCAWKQAEEPVGI